MKNTSIVVTGIVVATAAVAIGIISQGGNRAQQTVAASPRPTVTVTPTAPAKPAPTVTVTAKPTTRVPQACLDALRDADAGFGYGATAMNAISDLLIDPDKALEQITTANRALTALAPSYQANKQACREAGGE